MPRSSAGIRMVFGTCVLAACAVAGGTLGGSAVASTDAARISVSEPASPAFAANAGDPDVVFSNGTFFAFTTGTPLGNHIQVVVDTTGDPTSGYGSYTGQSYGSTALPNPPSWQQADTQTSPGVAFIGGHWVMWYDASIAGHAADSGFSCLAVATAATLTPTSPVFTDNSTGSPWCPAGGVLDPSPFVDPTTHVPYLVWKTNDGSSAAASQVWSVPLSADGTGFAGSPSLLMTVTPSEQTTDNPQLVTSAGAYYLLFSGGNFEDSSYNEQMASCTGPLGPCANPAGPFLSSYGGVYGPGGGSIFQDASGHQWLAFAVWNNPCTNCTSNLVTNQRQLYIGSTDLAPITPSFTFTGMAATPSGNGYWLVDSGGGVHPHGAAVSYGSMVGATLNAPINHMVSTPDGHGYWMVAADGGIFSFGDARFFGSMGGQHLNAPVVDLAPTPDGGGYWLVASDGGIFAFGDAQFFGSMGGAHLNRPVVGMSGNPTGQGYWLVASDGGIFAFGSAGFYGSTGAISLNLPVNGMAATTDGNGYWLVASDGGIFAYGDAPFRGSMGGSTLAAPVMGMATDPVGAGYWMVGADGGVFSLGPPSTAHTERTATGSGSGAVLVDPVGSAVMPSGDGTTRWRIDELSRRAGLPVGTVRLYQRDGLVPSGRRVGRSMTYGVSHLNRLIRIRQLKAANFTLTAIKRMIDEGQFVMLDRVFGTDRRPRTGPELAEEVGVEPGLVEMLKAIGFLADPGDRGAAEYDGGEASVVQAIAQLMEMGTPAPVLSVVLPLYVRHMEALQSDLVGVLSGRGDLDHGLPREVVLSYAKQTSENHEAFLYRWDVVVDYLHHRMIQQLVHRAVSNGSEPDPVEV